MNGERQPTIRGLQIIAFGLIAGLVIVAALLAFIRQQDPLAKPILELPFTLSYIALGLVPLSIAVSQLAVKAFASQSVKSIRNLVESNWNRPPSEHMRERLFAVYQGCTMVALAMPEAMGILGAILFFLEGSYAGLAAAGMAAAWMCLIFPTRSRLDRWIEKREMEIGNAGDPGV